MQTSYTNITATPPKQQPNKMIAKNRKNKSEEPKNRTYDNKIDEREDAVNCNLICKM